jgi:hypothetical protein
MSMDVWNPAVNGHVVVVQGSLKKCVAAAIYRRWVYAVALIMS